MKYIATLSLITLATVSCDDHESPAADARTDKPFYRDVEFYIQEEPLVGARSGVLWESDQIGTSFSIGDLDEATNRTVNEYAMKTAYRGSDNSKKIDFHTITLTPPNSDPIVIEVAFDGKPSELWNDDRYTAGIQRNETKKANKSEMATPRKPSD